MIMFTIIANNTENKPYPTTFRILKLFQFNNGFISFHIMATPVTVITIKSRSINKGLQSAIEAEKIKKEHNLS